MALLQKSLLGFAWHFYFWEIKYNPKSEKVGTVWKTQIKKKVVISKFTLTCISLQTIWTKYFMFCLWGSPVCQQIREKIIEMFKNNVPQRKIGRDLDISPSTVHNIIKRFKESGGISVRKGQGRKPKLNNRDLRSLRRHCIKNRHSSISDITTWAQDYFGKPLSSTTIRSYIHKCQLKLYCAKRKPYVNSVQKRRRLLWARRHLGWTITQWKRVLWSDESVFQVFFGRNGRRVLRTKEEKDHPDCYQQQVQKPGSVMVWDCVSALGKGNLHFCDGTINAEKYIEILEHNMLPSRRHLFQGRPCIFQQDNAKPHSAHITKSWLRRKRVRVLDWPACSPDLSPIENVWRILKRKMRQRRPRTVAHLKTCLQEEWDKITPETLHHLVSSVPKRLLSVVKRNGNITNALLSQLFLECVAGLNDRKGCIFTNDMKLTRQNMKYFVFILSAMKYKSK